MPKPTVIQASVKTGGKLYIAGEYSVLTAGQTALIQFIPIFMSAEVKEAPSTQLSSDMFDYSAVSYTHLRISAKECLGSGLIETY